MHSSPHLRVPVGRDSRRWSTFRAEKTLVVAARTVTSSARVLECLPAVLRDDSRVSVVFAHDPTSAFNEGVLDLLHDAGCRVMPWDQLRDVSADLIISASENVDLPEGDCPVLVLPHGVGFQKLVPDSRSDRARLSGVVPDALLEAGRAWLAVSHPGQEQQLRGSHPGVTGRTLLIGDPCLDDLLASRPHRETYRRALGIADHQRLVMLSSTWGPTSLLGRDPGLPARLLGELPYDEYRVGAIVHPNVWAGHGAWQLSNLLASALEAGLLLVPPVHTWRPALVAADAVIGDHGSVTLYGASLGIPLLIGSFGSDAVPGTAVSELARVAPRLDPLKDLRGQVDKAVELHEPRCYEAVAQQAFAEPGQALARLRSAVYRLLELPEPPSPPPGAAALGAPEMAVRAVMAWTVTTVVSSDACQSAVTVDRIPSTVHSGSREGPARFTHLACQEGERDGRLVDSASVLFRPAPADSAEAATAWIADTLARLPGCLIAAVALPSGRVLAGLRDGRIVETAAQTAGNVPAPDPGLAAAVVYGFLRAGRPLEHPGVELRLGAVRTQMLALRVVPGGGEPRTGARFS
ncbi:MULTISPECIES: hypothetical protein [unclassified Streptomyces]|uniref:hypothetical protein n=1 Tax=unclassified Streptomyces TaxID=2593676 RepID=UPI002E12DEF8|nr:hypothetical protein OG452_05600 [Streptomyces sp. NBC_01197]WSS53787.1 hypothetical protein OG708_29805 [Streptomyces sp. NBC_01180]